VWSTSRVGGCVGRGGREQEKVGGWLKVGGLQGGGVAGCQFRCPFQEVEVFCLILGWVFFVVWGLCSFRILLKVVLVVFCGLSSFFFVYFLFFSTKGLFIWASIASPGCGGCQITNIEKRRVSPDGKKFTSPREARGGNLIWVGVCGLEGTRKKKLGLRRLHRNRRTGSRFIGVVEE